MSFADAGTIVVVEDDAALRRLLATALGRAGFRVDVYADPVTAIEAVRTSAPLLVLTDIAMPGMDGFELAAHVREARPGVPVLFMSGHHPGGDIDDDSATDDAGTDDAAIRTADVLAKPFTIDQLLRRVADAIAAGDDERSS